MRIYRIFALSQVCHTKHNFPLVRKEFKVPGIRTSVTCSYKHMPSQSTSGFSGMANELEMNHILPKY